MPLLEADLAAHEFGAVADPVRVPHDFITEARLVHPPHEACGEGPDGGAEDERDGDEAVGGRVDQRQTQVTQPDAAAEALDLGGVERLGQHEGLGGQRHGGLRRDIDVLAETRGTTLRQCHQGAAGSVGAGVQPGLGQGHPQRCPVLVTGESEGAAGGQHHQVGGPPTVLRATPPERRDRHRHQPRVRRPERAEVDGHGARLDQHVGVGRQRPEVDGVERHRTLAATERQVPQGSLGVLDIVDERLQPPDRAATRRLDGDHLRAKSGEDEAGHGAALIGQIEHPVRRQHRFPQSPAPHPQVTRTLVPRQTYSGLDGGNQVRGGWRDPNAFVARSGRSRDRPPAQPVSNR